MLCQGLQEARVERLLQHRTHAQGARRLLRVRIPGHDDDGDAGVLWIAQLPLAKLPPVHFRHHQVDDDEARAEAVVQRRECLLAVVREPDIDARVAHEEPDGVAVLDLVVDDEDGVRVVGQRPRA